MIAAALLCLVSDLTLVNPEPSVRLPDVAASTAVLGAWVVGRCVEIGARSRARRFNPRLVWPAALVLVAVMSWTASAFAPTGDIVRRSKLLLSRPDVAWNRLASVTRLLRGRPIDFYDQGPRESSTGLGALSRYVLACTNPSDRLLVTGLFEPQIFFYAERAFAGGQVHFLPGWHAQPSDQQLTIERLRRESVPIALDGESGDFERAFPAVREYINAKYVVAKESTFGWHRPLKVLVDPNRPPTGTYEPLGLPCFRSP